MTLDSPRQTMFNRVCLVASYLARFFKKTIAPIKANLPRGRDAKPRVFIPFFVRKGRKIVWLPKAIWKPVSGLR
jgi:hypothetical protein